MHFLFAIFYRTIAWWEKPIKILHRMKILIIEFRLNTFDRSTNDTCVRPTVQHSDRGHLNCITKRVPVMCVKWLPSEYADDERRRKYSNDQITNENQDCLDFPLCSRHYCFFFVAKFQILSWRKHLHRELGKTMQSFSPIVDGGCLGTLGSCAQLDYSEEISQGNNLQKTLEHLYVAFFSRQKVYLATDNKFAVRNTRSNVAVFSSIVY